MLREHVFLSVRWFLFREPSGQWPGCNHHYRAHTFQPSSPLTVPLDGPGLRKQAFLSLAVSEMPALYKTTI